MRLSLALALNMFVGTSFSCKIPLLIPTYLYPTPDKADFSLTRPNLNPRPLTPRTHIGFTCPPPLIPHILIALNEVVAWSDITLAKLHTADEAAMPIVWRVFSRTPQTMASRLVLMRRYSSVIREVSNINEGSVMLVCWQPGMRACRVRNWTIDRRSAEQVLVLVSFRSSLARAPSPLSELSIGLRFSPMLDLFRPLHKGSQLNPSVRDSSPRLSCGGCRDCSKI